MSLQVTDIFSGGGGSSTGLTSIPGIAIRIAANHDQFACDVHNLNHPSTDHACVDLHEEKPSYFPKTDILWASPECTKWSQANGADLPDIEEGLFEDPNQDDAATRSRLLMFDVLKFIEHHRYRAVMVENVVDIATQLKYALAWHVWRYEARKLRYRFRVISLNSMHAQYAGLPAPQSRDRIYIGMWPEGEAAPDFERILRPQAYCPSCDSMVEAQQAWKNGNTVGRYRQAYVYVHAICGTVVEPGYLPAIAAIDWTLTGQRIGDRQLKDFYSRNGVYLGRGWLAPKTETRVVAGIARYWGPIQLEAAGNTYDAADPNHPAYGDPNSYYRAWSVTEELRALHTTTSKALAIPVEGRDGKTAQPVTEPFRTQTTRLETGLVTPFVAELRGGGSDARSVTEPAATFCANGNHHALVAPYYSSGSGETSKPATEPLGTLTTVDRYALVHRNNSGGAEMTTPVTEYLRTLTSAGHQSLIQGGIRGGRPKVTAADLSAARELLADCTFRMFEPHEVAAGMAFPADYKWNAPDSKGRPPSKRKLVKLAGNAVTPPASRDCGAVLVDYLGGAA